MKHVMSSEYRKAVLTVVVVGGVGVGAALLARRLWLRQKNVDRSVDGAAGNSEVSSLVEPASKPVNTTSDVNAKGVSSSNSGASKPVSVEKSIDLPSNNDSLSTSGTFEKIPSPAPATSDQLRSTAVASPPKILNTKPTSATPNDVTVVMKDKNDIVVVETEPSKKVGASPAAHVPVSLEPSKAVQQPVERSTVTLNPTTPSPPSPSPLVKQSPQPVNTDAKLSTPTTRTVKDTPEPVPSRDPVL